MTASPQKKRLVRGLADMMGFDADAAEAEGQRTVPLAALKPGRFNPRRNFSEAQLEEIAVSIRDMAVRGAPW